jgi:hypothetical protein
LPWLRIDVYCAWIPGASIGRARRRRFHFAVVIFQVSHSNRFEPARLISSFIFLTISGDDSRAAAKSVDQTNAW